MHLLIITPIFPPAQGGAATYYKLLSEGLIEGGYVNQITVVTEHMPGLKGEQIMMDGKLRVVRLFPYRAGGQLNKLSQYFRYAVQNIQYLTIPKLVRKLGADTIVVHSGFHNHLNTFGYVIPRIGRNAKLIADVRDQLMPEKELWQLDSYNEIIVCSENVLAHVHKNQALIGRVHHIPVVQEAIEHPRSEAGKTLDKYGLLSAGYLLYAGLIKRGKGIDLLFRTYKALRAKGFQKDLVLIGLAKDAVLAEEARQISGVQLFQSLPRQELLDLMAEAALNINLSRSEGMPRVCLEAIALGARVLLPQGIPEFSRHCPHAVACATEPAALADQIKMLLAMGPCLSYPLADHELNAVLADYATLFRATQGSCKNTRSLD